MSATQSFVLKALVVSVVLSLGYARRFNLNPSRFLRDSPTCSHYRC